MTASNIIVGATRAPGSGTLFNLGSAANVTFQLLHQFTGIAGSPTDGDVPGGLTAGLYNRFYGASMYGGTLDEGHGDGTVFDVSSSAANPRYEVLYRFRASGYPDGINPPRARLAVDPKGRLYGLTYGGGTFGFGTVYVLQHVEGVWQEQILYSFSGREDLGSPSANVVLDRQGNLYGCAQGGSHGQGGIFTLSSPARSGDTWQEKVIYNFGDHNYDPATGSAGCGITMDQTNDFIVGTSYSGGLHHSGTLFTLAPRVNPEADWIETVGYSFDRPHTTGINPIAPPLEVNGIYYGGTSNGLGQIYAFKP